MYAEELLTAEKFRSEVAMVTITLTDDNDNSPIFQPSNMYNFIINKTVVIATKVGQVRTIHDS